MKAAELRIGNWVNGVDGDTIITEILKNGVNVLNPDDTPPHYYDWIEPIPLTEEWLLKFSFVPLHENRYGWYGKQYCCPNEECCLMSVNYKSGVLSIENLDDDNSQKIPTYGGYQFKYVHQLQNLYFALTGEELTIKE